MSRQKAQQFLTEAMGVKFPYVNMGRIDSLDLWGPSELMILQLYADNKQRWKHVADIGANLGLHTIVMARLGWQVNAYEPQPDIYAQLCANLVYNNIKGVFASKSAVHTSASEESDFVRVHNNLTGSHLAGYKDSYGPRNVIKVRTVDCKTIWPNVDFAKIDSEGNEAALALTMTAETMANMDCIMEVRNEANARIIFDHFKSIGTPIWAQKIDWRQVHTVADMPHVNREGSIFVGREPPWQ